MKIFEIFKILQVFPVENLINNLGMIFICMASDIFFILKSCWTELASVHGCGPWIPGSRFGLISLVLEMRSEFLKFCCWRMSFNAVVLKQNYQSIKCGIKEKVILANTILYIILEQQKHSDSLKKRFQRLLKLRQGFKT